MLTKFIIGFTILALVAAVAGTVPGKIATANVTLTTAALVKGTALKAGDYRVIVTNDKVIFTQDKLTLEIPAKIETGTAKFDVNRVQYDSVGNQTIISQIALGGTKIRILFQ